MAIMKVTQYQLNNLVFTDCSNIFARDRHANVEVGSLHDNGYR